MSVTHLKLEKSEKMAMQRTRNFKRMGWPLLGVLSIVAAGCHTDTGTYTPPQQQKLTVPPPVAVGNPPGLPVASSKLEDVVPGLVASYTPVPRSDIFALHEDEADYDVRARNERIVQTTGGFFGQLFTPKIESVQVDQVEPQPFRRLAGVLVGDSVMAIIDMGNNSPMQVIRPGMQIPNSPWKVISIDEDKAVLVRGGNKLPKKIVVRLQGPAVSSPVNFGPGIGGGNPNPNPGGNGGNPPQGPGGRGIRGGSGGIS